MRGPSRDQLLSETARLAYHFHWPLDTILDLEHADRHRFLDEAESMAVGATGDLTTYPSMFDETRDR